MITHSFRQRVLAFAGALLLLAGFWSPARAQSQLTDAQCMRCHRHTTLVTKDERGIQRSAHVDPKVLQESVHAGLSCTDCHSDITKIPHAHDLKPVDCSQCHDTEYHEWAAGIHGNSRLNGNLDAPSCVDCHGRHDIRAPDDSLSQVAPQNQPKLCDTCHGDQTLATKYNIPVVNPGALYMRGAHGRALAKGNDMAPTCSTCHESHHLRPVSDPESPIYWQNIPNTCGICHGDIAEKYLDSVHGKALMQGIHDAPNCTDCHGAHAVEGPESPTSPVSPERVSQSICATCHSNEKLNEKYGIPTDRVLTYESSYHGLAVKRGSKVAANCTSCHGVHDILPASDPRSRINPNNLEKTCGTCHPGAGKKFASVKIHDYRSPAELKAARIIKNLYILLIVSVIGGMFLHNFIIWLFYVIEKFRKARREQGIQRFNVSMVIQHFLLLTSFTTLVITGFALKFPNAFLFRQLLAIGMTEPVRALIHRIAGSTLLAVGMYHLFWLFFSRQGRSEIRNMLPTLKDVTDVIQTMRYYLRLSNQKPQYDKYSYAEKAEYWALIWGTAVMGITGLCLWFPVQATAIFGSWIISISTIIHYYEAILATLAIIVWHFFFVIFHPEEYPLNTVCLNGKVSAEEVHHNRTVWLNKLIKEQAASRASREEKQK